MSEILEDKFNGGMVSNKRTDQLNEKSVVKNFDIYQQPHKAIPTKQYITDMSFNGVADGMKQFEIQSMTYGGEKLIAVGKGYTGWADMGYQYRIKVTPTALATDSDTSTHYLNLANMPLAFWTTVKSDGSDVRIKDSLDLNVPFVIYDFNKVAKTGTVFLNKPFNTIFYIYYGNANALSNKDQPNSGEAGIYTPYEAAYTYNNGTIGSTTNMVDLSGNGHDTNSGTGSYSYTVRSGFFGNSFDGSVSTNSPAIYMGTSFSYSFLYYHATSSSSFSITPGCGIKLNTAATNKIQVNAYFGTSPSWTTANAVLNVGAWNLIAVTKSGSTVNLYVNGVNVLTNSVGGSPSDVNQFYWNTGTGGKFDQMLMDNGPHNATFFSSQYNNYFNNTSFFLFGSQETLNMDNLTVKGTALWTKDSPTDIDWKPFLNANGDHMKIVNSFGGYEVVPTRSFIKYTGQSAFFLTRVQGIFVTLTEAQAGFPYELVLHDDFYSTKTQEPYLGFQLDDEFYFRSGYNTLNSFVGTTLSQDVIVAGNNENIKSSCQYGDRVVVVTQGTNPYVARLRIYDTVSPDALAVIELGVGAGKCVLPYKGALLIIVDRYVTSTTEIANGSSKIQFMIYEGGQTVRVLDKFESIDANIAYVSQYGLVSENKVSFIAGIKTDEGILDGQWSIGQIKDGQDIGISMSSENPRNITKLTDEI